MTPQQQKSELTNLFAAYNSRLDRLYDTFVNRLLGLGYNEDVLQSDALFNFDNMPELNAEVDDIFEDFVNKQLLNVRAAIGDGVALAYSHDKLALRNYSLLSESAANVARKSAANAFFRGRLKSAFGLNLSQLVWNYSQQAKSEFEVAMSNVITDGIKKGTSAEELGRQVRQQLNHPDMMYRRYHEKVIVNGEKKDVVTWRRRVIDEDGKVRFVKQPLEKVGTGTYRSARMNAYRLTRSEINMAYHRANHGRWLNEPFVIGIHIRPSDQHPEEDICDELEGFYPKDFLFIGWHPACMDSCTPITLKGDERKEFYKRVASGEDMSGYVSPNRIKDVPENYKKYILENVDKIINAEKRGKLAWHLRENKPFWQGLLTKEQAEDAGIHFDLGLRRKELTRLAKEQVRGQKLTNDEFSTPVNVSSNSIKRWLSQPHSEYAQKNEMILDIQQTFREARYMGHSSNDEDTTHVKQSHIFQTRVNDKDSWIIVREYNNGTCCLHSISDSAKVLTNIEK